jgi:hypothetical protein
MRGGVAEKRGGAWMDEVVGQSRLFAQKGEKVRLPVAHMVRPRQETEKGGKKEREKEGAKRMCMCLRARPRVSASMKVYYKCVYVCVLKCLLICQG